MCKHDSVASKKKTEELYVSTRSHCGGGHCKTCAYKNDKSTNELVKVQNKHWTQSIFTIFIYINTIIKLVLFFIRRFGILYPNKREEDENAYN